LLPIGRCLTSPEFAAWEVRRLSLRLIAGKELTRLMIDHQVEARHEAQPVPKTGLDFWEEA